MSRVEKHTERLCARCGKQKLRCIRWQALRGKTRHEAHTLDGCRDVRLPRLRAQSREKSGSGQQCVPAKKCLASCCTARRQRTHARHVAQGTAHERFTVDARRSLGETVYEMRITGTHFLRRALTRCLTAERRRECVSSGAGGARGVAAVRLVPRASGCATTFHASLRFACVRVAQQPDARGCGFGGPQTRKSRLLNVGQSHLLLMRTADLAVRSIVQVCLQLALALNVHLCPFWCVANARAKNY